MKHEVAIRKKKYKQLESTNDETHSWFKYVNVSYDDETGLKYKPQSEKQEYLNKAHIM